MAQKYKDEIETRWGTNTIPRKGVTIIHLFNEEWRLGRLNWKKGKEPHIVIYAPDDKQYDCYGIDALEIFDIGSDNEYWNDRPETVDRAKAKIWILTNILDDRDAWCFDMKGQIPFEGLPVKVIYENGTIKWIDAFSGDWSKHRHTHKQYKWKRFEVVAWRIKGNKPKK